MTDRYLWLLVGAICGVLVLLIVLASASGPGSIVRNVMGNGTTCYTFHSEGISCVREP